MDLLDIKDGGQPFFADDFKFQQDSIVRVIESQHKGRGAFVLSGCQVSGNTISDGLVYISGKILEFEGAVGVVFPVYIKQGTPLQYEERFFTEEGVNKTTRIRYFAEVTSVEPVNEEYINFQSNGARRFLHPSIIEQATEVSLSDSTLNGLLTYRKVGGMVEVTFDVTYTSVPGYNHSIYTLPIGYRSVNRVFASCVLFDGGFSPGTAVANVDGSIAVYEQRAVGERTIATLYFASQ